MDRVADGMVGATVLGEAGSYSWGVSHSALGWKTGWGGSQFTCFFLFSVCRILCFSSFMNWTNREVSALIQLFLIFLLIFWLSWIFFPFWEGITFVKLKQVEMETCFSKMFCCCAFSSEAVATSSGKVMLRAVSKQQSLNILTSSWLLSSCLQPSTEIVPPHQKSVCLAFRPLFDCLLQIWCDH